MARAAQDEASGEPRRDVFMVVCDGSSLMMATELVTAVQACAEAYQQHKARQRSFLTPSKNSQRSRP